MAKAPKKAPKKAKKAPATPAPIYEEEEGLYSDEGLEMEANLSHEDSEEGNLAFDDVMDEADEEEDFDGDIRDDDDFEVKAEKYRRRMMAQKRLGRETRGGGR